MKQHASFGAFAAVALALSLLVISSGSHAQTTAGSNADSTAVSSPQNIGNPNIAVNSYGSDRVRYSGMPVASAGSTFVSAPSSDTCSEAGDALAVQTGPVAFNANKGGGMQSRCNDRADTRSMKETGEDAVAITMRHCQNPEKAAAYEDAADLRDDLKLRIALAPSGNITDAQRKFIDEVSFRCPDRLRPEWALEREGKVRAKQYGAAPAPVAQPKPWAAGG